ncbi:MAG: ribonuclease T2 [Pseudomonadota bacterium]
MRLLLIVLALLIPASSPANDRPGDFSHYVLALSWNAAWCTAEGDAWDQGRGAAQCDPSHAHGWLLHGLWPQRERDWPEYCKTSRRDPTRSMSAGMADIMGSAGSAWHQWKKHGRCADLEAEAYFDLAREAYDRILRPAVLRQLDRDVVIDPDVIEDAFLEANPQLRASGLAVTCRDGLIREVRICLSKALVPRACGAPVARGCRADTATFLPMR